MTDRVLILCNSLSGGGAEAVAREMLENIAGAACVLFENDDNIYVPGKKIWTASSKGNRGVGGKIFINLWRLLFIQFIKLKYRPKFTISHLEGPNFANLVTINGGKRFVFVHNAFSHSYREPNFPNALKRFLGRSLYSRASKVIGVSPFICEELEQNERISKQKILFLPNPINVSRVQSLVETKYPKHLEHIVSLEYIICVGSLTEQKNHRFALLVFRKLKESKRKKNLKLVILGRGPLLSELVEFGESLGLNVSEESALSNFDKKDRSVDVFFVGFQPNPYRLIGHAKAFFMPSKWEGLPIALLEALALEIPIVISNCSSSLGFAMTSSNEPRELLFFNERLETDCGWIVNCQNESAETIEIWQDCLERVVLESNPLNNCDSGPLAVVRRFDVAQVREAWKSLLSDST